MSSMVSVSSTTKHERDFQDLALDLQVHNVARQTPTPIKRLLIGIVVILIGIIALISMLEEFIQVGVEASVSLAENSDLATHFTLITNFQMRYKMNLVLASMGRSYMPNLKKGQVPFENFLRSLVSRIETMSSYNQNTRKLLFAQSLTFDNEMITIPEAGNGTRAVTFSHAALIVTSIHNIY
jgi:hypothetical protein